MTVPAKPARNDPGIDAAPAEGSPPTPEAPDAGKTSALAEAVDGRAFWYGPVAPLEALLPPGVNPTRLRQMPVKFRGAYVRAVRGEASPLQAIKSQCSECMGYDRLAVAECPAPACPLWRYRPWQSGDGIEEPAS
jgi:hypothetical protein